MMRACCSDLRASYATKEGRQFPKTAKARVIGLSGWREDREEKNSEMVQTASQFQ